MQTDPPMPRSRITPPVLPAWHVARPALLASLGDLLRRHRLLLLSAPAGFGKTSALVELLPLPPDGRVAWVRVQREDSASTLAAALAASLRAVGLPAAVARGASLREQVQGTAVALATVRGGGTLVLDELDEARDPHAFELVDRLVDALPEDWRIAVTARVDPPLRLARRLIQGELSIVRAGDLRFRDSELRLRLASQGDADALALDALERATEGWPAVVQLLRGASEDDPAAQARRERHLRDYLEGEVLAPLPPSLRAVLSRTASVDDADAGWVAMRLAMSEARAQALLAELEQRGLLLPGAVGRWRVQPALRRVLQGRRPDPGPPVGGAAGGTTNVPPSVDAARWGRLRLSALTPREREVLERLAHGDSNKAIAQALRVSEHTVKRHVARVLDRLGAGSRVQAADWFRRALDGAVRHDGRAVA